jgi:autotransporter adhesin
MGASADAHGDNSQNVALGSHANASGNGTQNTAVGANSVATGTNSSSFGSGTQAAFVNSAAFGSGAKATRANQQVFGTSSNTYTLPGVTSAASLAAQSGPTQVVTTDASGNLGATLISNLGLGTATDVSALSASLDQLTRRVNKTFTGVAMAFAMSGVPSLLATEKFALSANWGTFQGENGAALSGAVRIYRNVQLQGSFAYGFRENMAGGHAGLRFGF